MRKLLMLIGFMIYFAPTMVFAGSLALSWNKNPEPAVTGYVIYYGTTPHVYTLPPINVGAVTSVVISGLTENTTYFFVVAAKDGWGNVSERSEEASARVVDKTPPAAPTGFVVIP